MRKKKWAREHDIVCVLFFSPVNYYFHSLHTSFYPMLRLHITTVQGIKKNTFNLGKKRRKSMKTTQECLWAHLSVGTMLNGMEKKGRKHNKKNTRNKVRKRCHGGEKSVYKLKTPLKMPITHNTAESTREEKTHARIHKH